MVKSTPTRVLGDTESKRVEELVDKLLLPENQAVARRLKGWVLDAPGWAELMRQEHESTESVPALCLRYILNHMCPSLHHYYHIPSYPLPIEELNDLRQKRFLENTQAGLKDEEGIVIQEGVHYTKRAYDMLVCKTDTLLRLHQAPDTVPDRLHRLILIPDSVPDGDVAEFVRQAAMSGKSADGDTPFRHTCLSDEGIVGCLNMQRDVADSLPARCVELAVRTDALLPTYLFSPELQARMGWSDGAIGCGQWWYARSFQYTSAKVGVLANPIVEGGLVVDVDVVDFLDIAL